MSEIIRSSKNYIGYEYKEVAVNKDKVSMYIDGYYNFGWEIDENLTSEYVGIASPPFVKKGGITKICIKRNRKIINKVELTRLQQHFESCMDEIEMLDQSKTSVAALTALTTGIGGTIFMALATFAITNDPPLVIPCILLSIPGFIGWCTPYFLYRIIVRVRTEKITPLIESKYDEVHEICEKGSKLLIK